MRRVCFLLCVLMMVTMAGGQAFGRDATGAWLESSYLKSIHDDCRVFLEGIELFTQRDYPVFLNNVKSGSAVSRDEAETYIQELHHFEELLDSLYEEYITFKEAAVAAPGPEKAHQGRLSPLEVRFFQMLAYSYLRTGDFAMAKRLITNHDILSTTFTIPIRNIEGRLVDFPLTNSLRAQFKAANDTLTTLTLKFKNFYAADIPSQINAYIRVTNYDKENPINVMYMAYYASLFPGLQAGKERLIHVGQIIRFFEMLKYSSQPGPADMGKKTNTDYMVSYQFPIVRGDYDLVYRDPNIIAFSDKTNEITIERLCYFKGLARTDFRNLKEEEKQQQEQKMVVEENLSLKRRGKDYLSYKPGEMVPYGTYSLIEEGDLLGAVELVPCYRGGACKPAGKGALSGVTPVQVYDHQFMLYRDVLDLVRRNHSIYRDAGIRPNVPEEPVRLFPGCSPVK
ncbi:MAG: hypothetical protein SWH61_16505 [Thermodesulfobacteriota bacterium]|nr:hypothetical protein [Thermodesulfobacteriota bacterium]